MNEFIKKNLNKVMFQISITILASFIIGGITFYTNYKIQLNKYNIEKSNMEKTLKQHSNSLYRLNVNIKNVSKEISNEIKENKIQHKNIIDKFNNFEILVIKHNNSLQQELKNIKENRKYDDLIEELLGDKIDSLKNDSIINILTYEKTHKIHKNIN